jgi:heat shock protein HslJ
MRRPQLKTTLEAMLVVFSSCHAFAQVPGTDLTNTAWRLVKFQGSDDTTLAPEDRSKYTIAFGTDGGVSVRIDCNRGHSTWNSSGANRIQFGPLALTRAMCPAAPLNARIPKDWEYIRSYTLNNDHLFLSLMADGGIYEFEPLRQPAHRDAESSAGRAAASGTTASLENTYWKLVRLGKAPIHAASQQQVPHLSLNSESRRVTGSGGCNRVTGSYQLKGDQLTFSQMAGTMMACAKGMDTEKAFLDMLQRVGRWKITGQQLELLDASGYTLARFEARSIK